MKYLFFIIALLFVFSAHAETVDKIVAKVGSEVITMSDVAHAISEQRAALIHRYGKKKGQAEFLKFKNDVLNEMILRVILRDQIKKEGILVTDQEVDQEYNNRLQQMRVSEKVFIERLSKEGVSLKEFKDVIREELQKNQFIQRKISPHIAISDFDLQKEYDKNIKNYQIYTKMRFIEVFLTPDKFTDPDDMAKMAKKIQSSLKRGGSASALIKKYSSGAFAANGGDSGLVDAKSLRPEIQNVLSQLKIKETSPVLPVQQGLFVFKLLSKSDPEPLPFSQVANQIRGMVGQTMVDDELKKYLMSVKDATYVEIVK